MRLHEILTEGRDAPLYHATAIGTALKIVTSDRIHGDTSQIKLRPRWPDGPLTGPMGVSLSRDLRVALRQFGNVCFALDQALLRANYRIVPVDYWGHSYEAQALASRRKGTFAEAEEFLLGTIAPLDRYLVTIYITRWQIDWLERREEDTREIFAPLLDHPKLRIIDTRKPFSGRAEHAIPAADRFAPTSGEV